jgi:hypothetical protein
MGGAVSAIAGPVLGLAGGLISGGKAADASKGQAEALRAAADKASAMAQFNPYGMTTNFGTSTFDGGQGGYKLSPELQAISDRVMGYARAYDPNQIGQYAQPIVGGAQSLFGLGQQILPSQYNTTSSPEAQALAAQYRQAQQGLMPTSYQTGASPEAQALAQQYQQTGQGYLAQSPEEARAEYMRTQQAALAPGRAADEARLATANYGRGTGGLGIQTGTGTAPSNPLAQALYNARGQQDLQLATQAENAAQQRQSYGLGMLGQGYQTTTASEQLARHNMLGNLSASLGYGQQGYATGEAGTDLARQRSAADIKLGAGLFGTGGELLGQVPSLTTAGYKPLEAQLGLLGATEKLGQQPFLLSQDLANQYAQAGARQGQLYMQPQAAAAQAYSQYQGYSPMGSALGAAGSALGGGGAGQWFSSLLNSGSPASVTSQPGYGAGTAYNNMSSWETANMQQYGV